MKQKKTHIKKIFVIFIIGIMLMSLSLAQEITQEDVKQAGILPDSSFYGIKLAINRLTELLNENQKLIHAQQRLKEVEIMIFLKKTKNINKSIEDFNRIYKKVKNKTKLEEHNKVMENIGQIVKNYAIDGLNETERIIIKDLIIQRKNLILNESNKNYQEILNRTLNKK